MNKQAKEDYQNLWNEFVEVLPALVRDSAIGSAKGYTRKLNDLFTDIFEATDIVDEDGMMPDDDKVHPTHYQSFYKDGIDCLTAMEHAFGKTCVAHFALGNAMKYLWRHCSKGKMQDIDKAIEYLRIYKKLDVIDLGD